MIIYGINQYAIVIDQIRMYLDEILQANILNEAPKPLSDTKIVK